MAICQKDHTHAFGNSSTAPIEITPQMLTYAPIGKLSVDIKRR